MFIIMTLENKKKILSEFLNKYNLTESFNNTVTTFYQIGEEGQEVCDVCNGEDIYFESVDDYINHATLYHMLFGIGNWDETEEGLDFWIEANRKWLDWIAQVDL